MALVESPADLSSSPGKQAPGWGNGHSQALRIARYAAVSFLAAAAYLVAIGVPTAVIPNPVFVRMTPVTTSNVLFWLLPALLFGPLVATYFVPLVTTTCQPERRTIAGGLLSFLAVGCPICNKLVVLLLGVSGALAYFEPIQPLLGAGSVGLLAYALWLRLGRPRRRQRRAASVTS